MFGQGVGASWKTAPRSSYTLLTMQTNWSFKHWVTIGVALKRATGREVGNMFLQSAACKVLASEKELACASTVVQSLLILS